MAEPIVRSVARSNDVGSPFASFSAIVIFQNIDARIYNSAENIVQTSNTVAQQVEGINVKLKSKQHDREECVSNNQKKKNENVKKNGKSSISCSWMGHGPPIAHAGLALTQQPFWHRPVLTHWSLCAILVCAVGHVVNRLLGISWHSCCCRPEVQCSNQCTGT